MTDKTPDWRGGVYRTPNSNPLQKQWDRAMGHFIEASTIDEMWRLSFSNYKSNRPRELLRDNIRNRYHESLDDLRIILGYVRTHENIEKIIINLTTEQEIELFNRDLVITLIKV